MVSSWWNFIVNRYNCFDMIYMGSKNKLSKHILPIILKDRGKCQYFVDIFCGGGNLCQHVDGKVFAYDINRYAIAHLSRLKLHGPLGLPSNNKYFTEDAYKEVKNNKDLYKDWFVGHVGFNLSFGGKWFGGWRRDAKGKDYVKAGYEHASRQASMLIGKDITFETSDYRDAYIPPKSIIYADPPYANTTKYKDSFNHEEFFEWCRQKKQEGHTVFVSEYNAPEDFTCVWEKEVKMKLDVKSNTNKRVEKLFKL